MNMLECFQFGLYANLPMVSKKYHNCIYMYINFFCFSGTPVYRAKHNPIYCTSILLLLLLKWLVLVWQFVLIPQLHSFTSLGN